jgi:hypothetical protein
VERIFGYIITGLGAVFILFGLLDYMLVEILVPSYEPVPPGGKQLQSRPGGIVGIIFALSRLASDLIDAPLYLTAVLLGIPLVLLGSTLIRVPRLE